MSEENNAPQPAPVAEQGVTAVTQPPPLPLPATLPPADASAFKPADVTHKAAAGELEQATREDEIVEAFNEMPAPLRNSVLARLGIITEAPAPVTGTPAPARGFFTEEELRQNEIDARYKEHKAPDQKAGYCE